MAIDEAAIRRALDEIEGPEGGRGLFESGLVGGISIAGDRVTVALEVDPAVGPRLEALRQEAERRVAALPGVARATVVLSGKRAKAAPAPQRQHQPPPPQHGPGPRPKAALPGVKHIIAVASGKGGVGKSTTAANLALAFQALGKKVGVLDADIYGPSMQRVLGVSGKPDATPAKTLLPKMAHGLRVMSMGFLVPEDTAMIWRGPMVMGALQQMLRDVEWGELDILVVDMPPGTGDAQLTLAQTVPLAGAVIVSTPQDLALIDASRGVQMFRKVEVPVLGIVENMSTFICPNCQHETPIFGHGGARREAERLGVSFLGEIPLDMKIRVTSDEGTPIVVAEPDGQHATAYRRIAEGVLATLEGHAAHRAPPVIREE
ncbi:MAG TPA: Mrp/NBP35 family ATP-binding protein [Alphaproteobacteria bacterium]|nr:Mrp/NBP35 family ATP-binding protein [Alphaproteobacteria bacterium]